MPLPSQVQAELDAAEAIAQELNPLEVDDPNATPDQLDPEPQVDAPAIEPDAQPDPQPEPPTETTEYWKSRFLTLQGMFDQSRTEHANTLRDLNAQVTNLKNELSEAKKVPTPKVEPAPAQERITKADREAFGDDLVDMVQRAAAEIAEKSTQSLEAQLAAAQAQLSKYEGTVENVQDVQARSVANQFYRDLSTSVADWKAVNKEQGWLEWLGNTDPMSGIVRQQMLEDASAKSDVNRVAAMFNAYKATKPQAPAQVQRPNAELQRQISPGSKASSPPQPQQEQTVWSPENIEVFYKALARGDYKGKEAEAKRIEADIDRFISQ